MSIQLDDRRSTVTGHSSDVDILLHCGSVKFPVLQTSKSAIKLNDSHQVPQGDAGLETIVDGRSHRRPIQVLGTSPRPNWIAIVDR
jgi:hypothetical protein